MPGEGVAIVRPETLFVMTDTSREVILPITSSAVVLVLTKTCSPSSTSSAARCAMADLARSILLVPESPPASSRLIATP